MGSSKVLMEVGEDEVAVVTINNPPLNSLANSVFNGLHKCFKEVQDRDDIKAVVITGARGKFCGGADIRSFQKRQNAEEEGEKTILSPLNIINKTIEACKRPVVAAMEGFALGGGLELAMACHVRVAAKGTELGLLELQLGIIPSLGGTQRLPRLVGLEKALDMLLTSRTICAEEAQEYGLVDIVTGSSNLLYMARMQALKMVGLQQFWHISLHRMDKIGNIDEALATLRSARASAKRKFQNVSYPFMCLDVIEEGLRKGGEAGSELENTTSRTLVKTIEARALMHVFFAQRSSFKVFGVTNLGLRVRPIKRAAIVGCGLMGSGIATAFASNKIEVVLKDTNSISLEGSIKMIKENLAGLVRKGKLTELQAKDSLALVRTTENYCDFGSLNLVVESVYEDTSLKQRIFHELESVCSANCILASNTSSIDINTIGANISHPDRIVGAHFFSPAHVMQLFEIVQADHTSSQTVVDLLALAKKLKKIPLVVKSVHGFAANRLFVPYLMIATFLVDLGLDPYRIDEVVKEFGMPMGPFRVADLTGIKTFHLVSQGFFERSPDNFHKSPLIALLLKDNRQGKATKRGFYDYRDVGGGAKTPELRDYVEKSRQIAHVKGAHTNIQNISDAEIVEMIFLAVANEACKIMEDNVVTAPAALDLASVFGMGFPSYRGGIIFWADGLGPVYIFDQLKQWWRRYGDVYKPSSLLEECAAANRPLGRVSISPSKL
eukprot:c24837_g1_i1 orf=425-2593(-)